MSRAEYDVFVCYGEEAAGARLAAVLSAGLTRRGFRVFAEKRRPAAEDLRRSLIEQVPDFVAVLPPATLEALDDEDDPVRAEIAHAFTHRRNVVQVRLKEADGKDPGTAALFGFQQNPPVTFDEGQPAESIALVAHRLSSDSTVDERRIMRRSKRLFWFAAAILLAGVALQEVPRFLERWSRPRLLDPIAPFTVYWAGIGQRFESGGWREFRLGPNTAVAAGDRARLVFAPSAGGHAYVVLRDAAGEVDVLFPTDAVQGASRVEAGRTYVAPVGTGWLPIEAVGAGTAIYLIAGYDPVHNLEELIERREPAGSAASRGQLLDLTIGGLLDGRHGPAERRVWTGTLHPIDTQLQPAAGPASVAVTLNDGRAVTRALEAQRGLVSASVEIRLNPR
jgi:hypothetical protein